MPPTRWPRLSFVLGVLAICGSLTAITMFLTGTLPADFIDFGDYEGY